MCETLGTVKKFTSSYHPQTNGMVERLNHTLCQMLCAMIAFELTLDRFGVALWVTIRNLLDFCTEALIFSPTTSCSLSPGDHDRSRFMVQFGVILKS